MQLLALSQQFSKQLKVASARYLAGQPVPMAELQSYLRLLTHAPIQQLVTDAHKIAFWVNVYNGLTNLLIIEQQIRGSMKGVEGIYSQYTYQVGPYHWALDDIEHGLLRRNARPRLALDDPRRPYMVQRVDYRIHFALNCGALSCPPVAYYSPESLEQQLQAAEASFAQQEFSVNHAQQTIACSPLFSWYRADFGPRYLNNPAYNGYTVTLKPYNWHTV